LLAVVIFAVFSIYWGSVWSTPNHTLPGWIVDFDGGLVGQAISGSLSGIDPGTVGVAWQVVPGSQFPEGISQLQNAIVQEKTWYVVTINSGASANLAAAVSTSDASYDPSTAISLIGNEARNEYIYNPWLEFILVEFITISLPQLGVQPIFYTVDNLRPFDVPVASAVTFVGLIYLLILSFFIVNVSAAAREASGLEQRLTLGSLVRVRIATSFAAYFFIGLFYTLLSRAFQLPFDRQFGRAGFVIFWMLNWLGMLACGLALEAMITLLGVRGVPFFLMLWIISNVSVAVFPLQVLPRVYRYGYGFIFYNFSRAVRSIVFNTKNDVGLNFGVIIAWVSLSCITLPFFQWLMHRRRNAAAQTL
ncbi:hypothetical protein DFH06DRAFT_1421515, partial [Mycena polygramma]